MLMPKRTKYRRPHRVSYEGKAKGGKTIAFGEFGLQSLEGAWITDRQIEAARIAMTPYMKRDGKVWITIMFEIGGVSEEIAREALRLAAHKLPVKTKFVTRESGDC